MKFVDFEALKMHLPSHEKYIFHMRFVAFHNTSRDINWNKCV